MTSRRKNDRLKGWLSGFFARKNEIQGVPSVPQCHAGPGGFFTNAHDIVLNSPTMTSVHNTVTHVQGDRNLVTHVMTLLSQNIIRGAAHDSSARNPPPRCHPHTRVKLIARITAWSDSQEQQELVLWVTGPAGVGKSAVVQTFAEYLSQSKLLGASVFFSRPNKRNSPHGVFLTIAYQLATRIEAYRNFIVERLSLDPELPNGDMKAQFTTFIIEPFADQKIGVGGKRWGILLDGLDELEGEDAQCEIIQLISTFAHEHCDAPLIWIIASRPEPHISNTFEDDEVRRTCWLEYLPIDSTEACDDVERFLRESFKTIRKKFGRSVPSDWPGDAAFLKLTVAASGLFIYAEVVVQFIRDSYYSDPVSRLELLLSVIDSSIAVPTNDNPFVYLDALYNEILSSIPPRQWSTAKQLLGFVIHFHRISYQIPERFKTLRGMSILFGLTRHVIFACLSKCHSTLRIPDWKFAHKENLTFLHASFADYLTDSRRSKDFYVGSIESVEDDVALSFLDIWNECSGDDIATVSVRPMWHQYCSKCDDERPSRAITRFHGKLFQEVISCLGSFVAYHSTTPVESSVSVQLHHIHMIKLYYYFNANDLWGFVDNLMMHSSSFDDRNLLQKVQLKNLKFGHLCLKVMSPARASFGKSGKFSKEGWILHRPRSSAELKTFISELESIQEHSPERKAYICGGLPEGRVVVFRLPVRNDPIYAKDCMYYMIPYPELS